MKNNPLSMSWLFAKKCVEILIQQHNNCRTLKSVVLGNYVISLHMMFEMLFIFLRTLT